jgi:hypothetical protein
MMLRPFFPLATIMLTMLFALPASTRPFVDLPRDPDSWSNFDYIDKLQSEGFIEGFPDNTFSGGRYVTRYEMVTVVSRIVDRLLSEMSETDPAVAEVEQATATGPTEMSFTDVPPDHWAYQDVKKLENLGLLIGYPDARFDGDRRITKFEFAVILNRLCQRLPRWFDENGYDSTSDLTAQPYSDLTENHWAYRDIMSLKRLGFIVGYPDGTIKGNRLFTRWEMAMVIARSYDRLSSPLIEERWRMHSSGG